MLSFSICNQEYCHLSKLTAPSHWVLYWCQEWDGDRQGSSQCCAYVYVLQHGSQPELTLPLCLCASRRPDSFMDKGTACTVGGWTIQNSEPAWSPVFNDSLQQKFAPTGNKPEWQFRLQNHNQRPSEPLVEFPIELRMLADKAYPTWTAEQHQEVVSNQFIQGVKFQVVREMPATLDQAQELAHGLKSVELAQKCRSPVCTWSC